MRSGLMINYIAFNSSATVTETNRHIQTLRSRDRAVISLCNGLKEAHKYRVLYGHVATSLAQRTTVLYES